MVSSDIQSRESMCWLREVWRLCTRSSTLVLYSSGKYLSTYICPTASPSMLLGTLIARFHLGCFSVTPLIWVLKKSNAAS